MRRLSRTGRAAALALLAALLAPAASPALAQGVDCNRLLDAIHATDNDNGQRDTRAVDRAAAQQRFEIERTRRYAAQLGCDSHNGFFAEAVPPECDDIENRLARMQDNLERMEARRADAPPPDTTARRTALVARYEAACGAGGGSPANLAQDDFDSFRPDPSFSGEDLSSVPLNGSIMEGGEDGGRPAGRTICVRTCDGGYFPLAPRASSDQLDGLEQLCKASCPNTEARLYSMRNGDLAGATANDGTAYMALPAAFKFEKSFAPACTCKPPGRSWAEALAEAENLLEKGDHRDVTVTAALSDQMAKPLATPVPTPKGKAAGRKVVAPAPAVPDQKVAIEGQRAAQAPTASNASSGIGGAARPERVLGKADGLRITTSGPDGTSREIRLIVP